MSYEITPDQLQLLVADMTELELMRALVLVLKGTTTATTNANLDVLFNELDDRVSGRGAL